MSSGKRLFKFFCSMFFFVAKYFPSTVRWTTCFPLARCSPLGVPLVVSPLACPGLSFHGALANTQQCLAHPTTNGLSHRQAKKLGHEGPWWRPSRAKPQTRKPRTTGRKEKDGERLLEHINLPIPNGTTHQHHKDGQTGRTDIRHGRGRTDGTGRTDGRDIWTGRTDGSDGTDGTDRTDGTDGRSVRSPRRLGSRDSFSLFPGRRPDREVVRLGRCPWPVWYQSDTSLIPSLIPV